MPGSARISALKRARRTIIVHKTSTIKNEPRSSTIMNMFKRVFSKSVPEAPAQPSRPIAAAPGRAVQKEAEAIPHPAEGLNNYIMVVLDSCRYDSLMAAAPPILSRLGAIERRWSYASWTAPSHYNLLMGLLPHSSPPNVY